MLPYLPAKKQAASIIVKTKPEGGMEQMDESGEDPGLLVAAEDLLAAVKRDDAAGVAEAMRAAFYIMESEPHDEAMSLDEGL